MNAISRLILSFALFAYPVFMYELTYSSNSSILFDVGASYVSIKLDIELKSACQTGLQCASANPKISLLALALDHPITCEGDKDSCSALINDRNEEIGTFWRCMVEDPEHRQSAVAGMCVALSASPAAHTALGWPPTSLQARATTIAHKATSHAFTAEMPFMATASSTSFPQKTANPSMRPGESWTTLFTEPLDHTSLYTAGTGNFRWTAGMGPWINRTSSSLPPYATGHLNHTSRLSLSQAHPTTTVKTEVSGSSMGLATLSEEQPTAFTSLKPTKDASRTSAATRANRSSMLAVLLVMALVLCCSKR